YPEHDLILNANITLKGFAAGPTVLDAGGTGRVLTVDSGVIATISGITFKNGNAAGNGGGINNLGTLTLTGCLINGNTAIFDSLGGGAEGAGVYNAGTLTIQLSTIANNTVPESGAGIKNDVGGMLTITDSFLSDNSGKNGGAIYNKGTVIM